MGCVHPMRMGVSLRQTWNCVKIYWLFLRRNIEANLVIICVSLPSFRPFLRHVAPRWVEDDVEKDTVCSKSRQRDSEKRIFWNNINSQSRDSRQDSFKNKSVADTIDERGFADKSVEDFVQQEENNKDTVDSAACSMRIAEVRYRELEM